MKRRALLLAAAALFAVGVAAGAAQPETVTIENFAFGPTPLTVAAGTKVDGGKTFKSEALDTDDKFSFMFAELLVSDVLVSGASLAKTSASQGQVRPILYIRAYVWLPFALSIWAPSTPAACWHWPSLAPALAALCAQV
jgi:hypothetical protein